MSSTERSGWAVGWTWFAAIMMIWIGIWHVIAGLAAVIEDTFFVIGREYAFEFDVTTWGWIHLVAGVVVLIAAFGLFSGAVWARTVGVIMAVISGIAAFMWMPWYPVWAIVILIADIGVIWSLTVHGRDITES